MSAGDASTESPKQTEPTSTVQSDALAGAAKPRPTSESPGPNGDAPASGNHLTAEEQMALFEKQLKEDDWGHQPC